MKKMCLIIAMAALVCWLPGQALANLTYNSTTSLLPSEASYGTVVVTLLTPTTATVTITAITSPDLDWVTGASSPAAINVSGSFSATASYIGGSGASSAATLLAGPVTTTSDIGSFNLGAYSLGSYPESFTFNLTATGSTSWAQASDVLVANTKGYDAAAFLFDDAYQSHRGFVAELNSDPPPSAVPIPPSALLLGSGLLGLLGLGWRQRQG